MSQLALIVKRMKVKSFIKRGEQRREGGGKGGEEFIEEKTLQNRRPGR